MLNDIKSIVNDYTNAQDASRAFTFIEFIKAWGFNNDSNTFITLYRDYLVAWADKNANKIEITQSDFVRERMANILRNITLTYCSYEEQDFIAHIDWSDKKQVKALIPFYARKIKDICEFYRNKRNTVSLTFNRNNYKGSRQSIEQIIYEKLVDYLFNNRNLNVQVSDIQKDLMISIDNYIDTFSEYFDIPRDKSYNSNTRKAFLKEANMNQLEPDSYLRVEQVIADMIYSGDVYLEEIPLIAQLALDLNQQCVGDMLVLKNTLVANQTINLIPLTEQVELRRKLWQKYLGCDLWYLYISDAGDVTFNLLCKADNPTGNLLNCQMSDTATTPADSYELLSNIGLFFKPDKNSILKVNARSYTYEIDIENVETNTIYVFPDPSMYGDIGNNKSAEYPLMLIYRFDYDIKNMSVGEAANDPAYFIGNTGWHSYFTKEDEVLTTIKNYDYEYTFTSLANKGFISNYQVDIWGNQFGLFKGYKEEYYDEADEQYSIDENGNRAVKKITIYTEEDPETYGKLTEEEVPEEDEPKYILLNGGYFEDPRHPGHYEDGVYIPGAKFDYDAVADLTHTYFDAGFGENVIDPYHWKGLKLKDKPLIVPTAIYNSVDGMEFGSSANIKYIDHYGYAVTRTESSISDDSIVYEVFDNFLSSTDLNTGGSTIEKEVIQTDRLKLKESEGCLYIRDAVSFEKKPLKLLQAFPWLAQYRRYEADDIWANIESEKIIDFIVMSSVLILDTEKYIVTIPYNYDENGFSSNIGLKVPIILPKDNREITKILYNEKEQVFYILQMDKIETKDKLALIPIIYKFDAANYTITEAFNPYDSIQSLYEEVKARRVLPNSDIKLITDKNDVIEEFINKNPDIIYKVIFEDPDSILSNFTLEYSYGFKLPDLAFSYNNSYNQYVISYIYNDAASTPYIHEFKFTMSLMSRYIEAMGYDTPGTLDEEAAERIKGKFEMSVYTLTNCDGSLVKQEMWGDMIDVCPVVSEHNITVFTVSTEKYNVTPATVPDIVRDVLVNGFESLIITGIIDEALLENACANATLGNISGTEANIIVKSDLPELAAGNIMAGLVIVNRIESDKKTTTVFDTLVKDPITGEPMFSYGSHVKSIIQVF